MRMYARLYHTEMLLDLTDNKPALIWSSDNDSTGFWPPGSLHTLGADGHIYVD